MSFRSHLLKFDSVSSTQDIAKNWLKKHPDPSDMVWVRALHQTNGRGRQGRVWSEATDSEALLCTCGFRLPADGRRVSLLTLMAGAALFDCVEAFCDSPERLGIKWPNDLVIFTPTGFRKFAGILTEGFNLQAFTVGWGINFDRSPAHVETAAALREVGFREGADECFDRLQSNFVKNLESWSENPSLFEAALVKTLEGGPMQNFWGRSGRLAAGAEGKALGLAATGALRIQSATGIEELVNPGDFTFYASNLSKL